MIVQAGETCAKLFAMAAGKGDLADDMDWTTYVKRGNRDGRGV